MIRDTCPPGIAPAPRHPMTITREAGMTVVDTRTLRIGRLAGPVHWRRGVLYAAVKMTDTGRTRAVRSDVLAYPWNMRDDLADAAQLARIESSACDR